MATVLCYLLAAIVAFYLLREVRKPTRWVGRFFLWIMNTSHSSLTDWGLGHVPVEKNFLILDIGCGGGRTLHKLAQIAVAGKVFGVDYANGSVAASCATNLKLIQAGRVAVQQATVSQLPFPENIFDLAIAVETQYYWPDLPHDMREILRVLKPGGTLIVIAESYKHGAVSTVQLPVTKILKSSTLGVEEHREVFLSAGYTDIQIFEETAKGWICVTGKKPRPPSLGPQPRGSARLPVGRKELYYEQALASERAK